MLARKFSLNGKSNFERVEKEGKMYQSDSFGVSYFERGDDSDSRFGFIVSNKIAKEAVLRNRVKRALSESVRFEMTRLKNGYDVIFLVKQLSLRKSTDELMKEVRTALEKINLYK
jgi:ribonuclease P protein component